MIRNTLNEVQFAIRERFLGRLTLRSGLPELGEVSETVRGEREFYRLVLSRVVSTEEAQRVRQLVDVGCRNWSYVKALADFFPQSKLMGVDVDGVRRYWNLYRRIDVARANAKELCQIGHIAEVYSRDFLDFTNIRESEPILFSFFFPFVSENPCLQWGLPARFANFAALLEHSRMLVSKGFIKNSTWVSAHQGEWEAEEARECYARTGFEFEEKILSSEEVRGLWPSRYETRIIKAKTKD